MFAAMMDGIKEESVGLLFNLEVQRPAPAEEAPVLVASGLVAPKAPTELEYTAPSVDGAGGIVHRTERAEPAAGADAEPVEGEPAEGETEDSEPTRTRGRRTRSRGRRR
jgi:preprotein translocase subunit SecA